MVSAGTAFMLVIFYLICLLASRFSKRPWYKRMWGAAAFGLGAAIVITAAVYLLEVVLILLAF